MFWSFLIQISKTKKHIYQQENRRTEENITFQITEHEGGISDLEPGSNITSWMSFWIPETETVIEPFSFICHNMSAL